MDCSFLFLCKKEDGCSSYYSAKLAYHTPQCLQHHPHPTVRVNYKLLIFLFIYIFWLWRLFHKWGCQILLESGMVGLYCWVHWVSSRRHTSRHVCENFWRALPEEGRTTLTWTAPWARVLEGIKWWAEHQHSPLCPLTKFGTVTRFFPPLRSQLGLLSPPCLCSQDGLYPPTANRNKPSVGKLPLSSILSQQGEKQLIQEVKDIATFVT